MSWNILIVALFGAIQAVGAIVIGGGFDDWSGIPSLGTDPAGDVSAGDTVDYSTLWAASDQGSLYLSYQTEGNIDFASEGWRYNVFIDTDNDAGTGFKGAGYGIGADYLVQGGTLFSFSGAVQSDWSWSFMEMLSHYTSANRMEVQVAESSLGLSPGYSIRFLLHGDNVATEDYFPDNKSGLVFPDPGTSPVPPTDFLVYYGNDFSPTNLDIIGSNKTVVLHTQVSQLTPRVVAELKSRGVSNLLAYISIGEQHGTNILAGDGTGPVYMDETTGQLIHENLGMASYYVDSTWNGSAYVHDGTADETSWGGLYVHPNAAWRTRIRTQRIGAANDIAGYEQLLGARTSDTDTDRTHNFGFDGLFMDTLEGAAPWDGTGSNPWIAPDLRDAVAAIATNFPSKYLMANRGLYFYDPNQRSARFNVRPYDYTLRPYISGLAFESYYIGSDGQIVQSWFNDNRNRYAPKINAEASRPDGFSVFCIDYNVSNTPSEISNQVYHAVVEQGWIDYIVPESLSNIGSMEPLPPDTAPPVWDSTAGTGETDPPDRIGVQRVVAGDGSVVVEWDVARDQTGPVQYNIYHSTDPSFASNVWTNRNVVPGMGAGYSAGTLTNNAFQYTVTGLQNGVAYYFRVRAHDGTPGALEEGNTATLSATPQINTHYVSLSGSAQPPYGSWETAATNIQDAVDLAQPGATVYVAAGIYGAGTTPTPGHVLLNRLVVNKAITVKSADGPEATTIQGRGPVGSNAVRCVYLAVGAVLEGFTLTNGHTRDGAYSYADTSGGGVLCDQGGTLKNCIVNGNVAYHEAGGVYCYSGGMLVNCLVVSNSATWGGGIYCRAGGTIDNCTIAGNSAPSEGDGIRCYQGGTIENSIIYYNDDENYLNSGSGWSYQNCCTTPALGGNNIDAPPAFANPSAGDYRLRYASACIDAGTDLGGAIPDDLDGTARPIDGDFDQLAEFDIGAYEYNPSTSDADGDGSVDGDEWIAGTGIDDPASFFRVSEAGTASSLPYLSWQSVAGRSYTVFYQTNLLALENEGWLTSTVASVAGNGGTLSCTNPAPGTSGSEQFFLLEVEKP